MIVFGRDMQPGAVAVVRQPHRRSVRVKLAGDHLERLGERVLLMKFRATEAQGDAGRGGVSQFSPRCAICDARALL